jgi:type I restriction-modification system DNA methylase subunit/REP element-mobilizing transposase RayT
VRLILNDWKELQERDVEIALYERFKKYFGYLNTGFKGKRYDVFAYNGGLFKPDEMLDNLQIDDNLLYRHTFKLSEYDFESEVDVNILGHIFENSLNELDELKAEIEGKAIDKSETKRKKDGVFYTPKYITKYIVDNTVGKLCNDKKNELGIIEEEYSTDKKRAQKTKLQLAQKLTSYREWLLQITICDPACGSGAFLNQALNFLIDEHRTIDEMQAKLFGDSLVMSDIENTILENNLFGVDLNEESVEIAKLSLWLRTAQPNRKLNDLNNNIKCGNSLIDDPTVAGDKAFDWEKEFPQIFKPKNKKIWHVTWVTHDTRTSARMIKYKVREFKQNGEGHIDRPYYFDEKEAIEITRIISDIIVEDKYNCLEYNVCTDHIHMILVCDEEELPNVVRKLKGKSAQKFKEYLGLDKEETFHLWAQKFDRNSISSDAELQNKINYIRTNRAKHELPDINKGLQPLVEKMSCTLQHAFRTEYKGGFDVVIGNPPYGARIQNSEKMFYISTFKLSPAILDTYLIFIKNSLNILKSNCELGFIIPSTWLYMSQFIDFRTQLISNFEIPEVKLYRNLIFEDATVETCITFIKNVKPNLNSIYKFSESLFSEELNEISIKQLDILKDPNKSLLLKEEVINNLFLKISENIELEKIAKVVCGLTPYRLGKGKPKQTNDIVENRLFDSNFKKDETYRQYLMGRDFYRYVLQIEQERWISYGDWLAEPRYAAPFDECQKIIIRQTSDRIIAHLDTDKYLSLKNVHNLKFTMIVLTTSIYCQF